MKIAVVTQNAPLYLPQFLDDFFARLRVEGHEVTDIVVFSATFGKSMPRELLDRFRFYGPRDFVLALGHILCGKLLAVFHRFRPGGACHSLGNVIAKYGLHRFDTTSPNSPEFLARLASARVDLVVSVASPKIFRSALLRAPARGCINYHTALLPRYRGRQPLFWAMLHGEAAVGISVHVMDEKLDNGPILVQRRVDIAPDDTLHSLYLKTIRLGPELLIQAIRMIDLGDPTRIVNDASRATSFSGPSPEDARRFLASGRRFF